MIENKQIDILNIDSKIREKFNKEFSEIDTHKLKLCELKKSIEDSSLVKKIKKILVKSYNELEQYIKDLENKTKYNFYILQTIPLIEQYKEILKNPMKLNFLGKPTKNNKQKTKIINDYIDIVKQYTNTQYETKQPKKDLIICMNCSNKKGFDIIDENIYICNKCYSQQTIKKHNSSYTDIDRINISSKYMYDRKIHFRDCIKQYQGKQNSTIQENIYNELKNEFELHHLLEGDNNTHKKERFKNITKNHIMIFLKELGYSNQYENVHLIHYIFTGIKPDDISHLEDQLLDDFDSLTYLYDKMFKHINRKNFINTQYVLYQLLRRHKHKCKKEEFIILKTIDRKFFHDNICKKLFEILNWNHTPFY
jgi:hypothetical protein